MIYSESELEAILREPANAAPSRKDLARTALAHLRSARERETLLFRATDEINRLWDVIHERNLTGDIPATPPPEPWPEAGAVEKPISEVETEFYRDGERVAMHGDDLDAKRMIREGGPFDGSFEVKTESDMESLCGVTELFDSGPQRPHESLVWAFYHSVHVGGAVIDSPHARLLADRDLDEWRRRWPEESR